MSEIVYIVDAAKVTSFLLYYLLWLFIPIFRENNMDTIMLDSCIMAHT